MAEAPAIRRPSTVAKAALLGFIVVWFGIQIFFPLRHLLYPGNVSWTEEGHRFSWQMKLRDKNARALFTVRDPESGREWEVTPVEFLVRHQVNTVAPRPDMVLQFAHHLEKVWADELQIEGVEVRARVCASLNGRPHALLIDPDRDLTKVERNLRHADWILPLDRPFERPANRTGRRGGRC